MSNKVSHCLRTGSNAKVGKQSVSKHIYIYIYIHTYITLHYITLHYITLHYITLHYITLHYITLHYITLHYITYIHTYIIIYLTHPNQKKKSTKSSLNLCHISPGGAILFLCSLCSTIHQQDSCSILLRELHTRNRRST